LKQRADEKGLIFLSSAFSVKACDWLEELGMPAWKVASGEVHNEELLSRMERSRRPIILSSGLSNLALSEKLVSRFTSKGIDVALLHCTTMYPTPPEAVGLNVMETFCDHFADRAIVGLSDHSGTPYPGIVAAYIGASMIEAHITFHPAMFGPDVRASLDIEGFKTLVKGARFAWEMRRSVVDKDLQLNSVVRESRMFTRSLVARANLSAGQVLTAEDLAYKKPGGGMTYEERETLIGKALKVDLARDTPLDSSMVGETSC
jgi:N-acetylneuraminate synthase